MKKMEPNYRLVRFGLGTKVEKASRQQRTCWSDSLRWSVDTNALNRQAAQEQAERVPRHSKGQGRQEEEERKINDFYFACSLARGWFQHGLVLPNLCLTAMWKDHQIEFGDMYFIGIDSIHTR
jgi:hypothetical protein